MVIINRSRKKISNYLSSRIKFNRIDSNFIVSCLILLILFFAIFSGVDYSKEDLDVFSFIILPDTQRYVEFFPNIMDEQFDWIVEQKDILNIKAVLHLGDLVEHPYEEVQWKLAERNIAKLERSNIPLVLSRGNHDHCKIGTNFFDDYFPVSRFSNNSWWGGNYENSADNSYAKFIIGDRKIIIANLDWCPSKEKVEWMNETLKKYSEGYEIILQTHGLIRTDRVFDVIVCGNTTYIWEDLIKHHKNLRLVLNGHTGGEALKKLENVYGEEVNIILADYQNDSIGGTGWLRIMTFYPAKNLIESKTYSPYLDKFRPRPLSEFNLTINYDFN